MKLDPLYHWSPADRYESIRVHGLRSGSDPTVASVAQTHLCMSPDPKAAWRISGAMDYVSEIEYWDLWLVHLAGTDEVYVRPEYGPQIQEVNVRGHIPPDRLWWIGRRYDLGVPGSEQEPGMAPGGTSAAIVSPDLERHPPPGA